MFFFNIPTNERPCQSVAEDAWIQSLTSVWVEDVLSVAEIPDILENKEVGAIIFIIPLIVATSEAGARTGAIRATEASLL